MSSSRHGYLDNGCLGRLRSLALVAGLAVFQATSLPQHRQQDDSAQSEHGSDYTAGNGARVVLRSGLGCCKKLRTMGRDCNERTIRLQQVEGARQVRVMGGEKAPPSP